MDWTPNGAPPHRASLADLFLGLIGGMWLGFGGFVVAVFLGSDILAKISIYCLIGSIIGMILIVFRVAGFYFVVVGGMIFLWVSH